jgi:hypothetical protein
MSQIYPEQLPADVRLILITSFYSSPSPIPLSHSIFILVQVGLRSREIALSFQKERFATKRELNNLSRLAADASQIFPPDFVSATPIAVAEQAVIFFSKSA